jgi:Right handed beta helix region
MKRSVLALMLCIASIPSEAATAPTGILPPAFGLSETAGAPTHVVDNRHPGATDTNNPKGTPTRPRRTVPTTLPAGAVVQVQGGPYATGLLTWTSMGTQAAPVFVVGIGNPVFVGNGTGDRLRTAGSFMIVDGLTFDGVKHEVIGTAIAIRDCEVRNTDTMGVVVVGNGIVLHKNRIHHNGDANGSTERDTHGVYVMQGTRFTWVLENQIHHNGGDGVQVGQESSDKPWAQYVFIGGNTVHEDRENGVDIKQARDVVVSQNVIYGYVARSSSAGESIVVHNRPERVWILNNVVAAAHQGIVCTGAEGYFVVGNVIVGIRHNPKAPYDPASLWGASGILTYGTNVSVHVNNTIWASDAGIGVPTGGRTEVVNNIAGGLTQPTGGIRVASAVQRQGSVVTNNYTGGTPGFLNISAADFRLAPGAAVVDAGASHWVYDAFESVFGIPLDRDLYGSQRITGARLDIGAAEYAQ